MKHKAAAIILPGCCLLLLLCARARAQTFEYKIKAEFLERFTRFIDWPVDSPVGDSKLPFRLCVIGKNPFGTYLDEMAEEVRIKGKLVQVRQISLPEECETCDLLFIPQSEADNLQVIRRVTDGRPILTVGDTPGFGRKGVLINLIRQDSKIGFEIDGGAVRRSRLRFSSRLMALAQQVLEERAGE